ncbi:MAG: L-rhamnose isomerase [Chthoniobacteraceae bacterium]
MSSTRASTASPAGSSAPATRSSASSALCFEPATLLRSAEESGDFTSRLALFEEAKTLPLGLVWDEYCRRNGVPVGKAWLDEVKAYESTVLSKR